MPRITTSRLLGLNNGCGAASDSLPADMKYGWHSAHKNSIEHYARHPSEILWLSGPRKRCVVRTAAARLGVDAGPVDTMSGRELVKHTSTLLDKVSCLLKSEMKLKL